MPVGPLGSGPLGTTYYGSRREDFGLDYALSESPVVVRVVFNDLVDLSDPALTNPANYAINPFVVVHLVTVVSANTVRLTVDWLTQPIYTVTVSGMKSYWGEDVDPALDTATFFGFASDNRFDAVAVSRTKVRLLFEAIMQENAALTDPASYTVVDMDGTPKGISEVIAEGPPGARIAVALVLSDEIAPTVVYTARVTSTDVRTVGGYAISPNYDDFQLHQQALRMEVPYDWFGGVYEEGLLADHGGLAFFSPALEIAAPDSVIQVDDVSVCTRAYDKYEWPQPPDPPVFHLWAPNNEDYLLCGSSVLFADFDRLGGFRFDFGDLREDTLPTAVDSNATATLTETLDPTRVARLNREEWPLFDNVTTTPFILADNLTPIPPGGTTVIVLQP